MSPHVVVVGVGRDIEAHAPKSAPSRSADATEALRRENQAPTANAGPDQTVASGAAVNLDGTASTDPDGDALTYAWTQSGGPSVTLSGANTATPSFTAPTGPASVTFQLEVCDTHAACDTDSVAITVSASNADLAIALSAAPKPVS